MQWKTYALAATALGLAGAAAAAPRSPIAEGKIEFVLEHPAGGLLADRLPKAETTYFRDGGRQWRNEVGQGATLHGVVPGKTVQLLEMGPHKLAFLFPEAGRKEGREVRCEETGERRSVAGIETRRVEVVGGGAPGGRASYYVTDRIPPFLRLHPCLPGLALAYTQVAQGLAGPLEIRYTARRVEAVELAEGLFAIPADFRRIEVEGPGEIPQHLQKLAGGGPLRAAP